ncbi:oligosaccharide flippase family protein [Halarcobacter sp.]|uniref:oligosaccharide flippase family protein n=1 Tax=Halarcobacter sp. TaxID=2321133 RepID=UPI003B008516
MAILLIPIYTRYLSPIEYGIIDLFIIVGAIINIAISLEITQAIGRFYHDTKDEDEKMSYTSTAFLYTLVVYILYFIFSYILAEPFTIFLLDDIKYQNIFILASLAITTNGVFYFVQNQLKWQIQPKDSIICAIVNAFVTALIAIYLLVNTNFKVESVFIGQVFGNLISSLLSIYYAKSSYLIVFNFSKFKEMIKFTYPLTLTSIGVFTSMYIDRIAIKDLLGLEELGIYGIAARFASVTAILMLGFQSSLIPLVYKHYKEKETPKNISKIFTVFSFFALLLVCSSIVFSKEVLFLFTTESFYSASSLISFMVMSALLSNMYIFAPGIGIAKKTKITLFITVLGAVLNTILNYALIPLFNVNGATYATLISSTIVFFLYVTFSNRYYKITYRWKILFFCLLISLSSAITINSSFVIVSITSMLSKAIYILILACILIHLLFDTKNLKFNT